MSLINYPDVPNLPGVPAINRSSAGYVAAGLTILGEILPLSTFGLNWGITFLDGTSALTPDSFVSYEYKEEYRIPNYPTELGGFLNYNKVALPFDIKITVTCSGNGKMTTTEFLQRLYYLLETTTFISIITPDISFLVTNLIHIDYKKEATNGATMIIANLWFQEIRLTEELLPPTAQPQGEFAKAMGQLSAFSSKVTDSITSIF
jgi:hypothetical protein